MPIFKCKMCGGSLNVSDGQSVCECEYCGSKQTIPNLDDEKKTNLFNRANRLRFNNEFDKASGIYESIVSEFPEEPEAYWGLLLCKYGIEYVDDPTTSKKIPTCHRANYTSIFDDENFELCLEYSDLLSKEVYRNEAKEIDRIQKSILDVASKEEPFDVFICYKETDENGNRTKDSVLAQDIYDKLTDKGYKVFFSRITLEDKLGQEYEPYIFSALNSAKVMLAIGTKYEYYDAVWVKNEWSRFLDLMKSNKDKLLIPCYADIDAYDMPKEFKNLQGQDMNKLGFIQDLTRGIEKIIPLKKESETKTKTTTIIQQTAGPNVDSLLKRGYMALEDEDFKSAKEFFNNVLNMNAECGEAYLGLYLSKYGVKDLEIFNRYYISHALPMDKNLERAIKFSTKVEAQIKEIEKPHKLCKLAKTIIEVAKKKEAKEIETVKNRIRELQSEFKSIHNELKSLDDGESEAAKEMNKEIDDEKNKIKASYDFEFIKIENSIKDKDKEISILNEQRSKLGIFDGKKKKEIDSNIISLQNEKLTLEESMTNKIKEMTVEVNVKEKSIKDNYKNNYVTQLQSISKKIGFDFSKIKIEKGVVFEAGFFGDELLKWRVLDIEKDKAYIITENIVSFAPFDNARLNNSKKETNDFDNSYIKKYLNEYFNIQACVVPADGYVTLLSKEEVEKYFTASEKRKTTKTKYAQEHHPMGGKQSNGIYASWWLRTKGEVSSLYSVTNAMYVSENGFISDWGSSVDSFDIGVRPALWISIN